jgi:NAD-dependent DNA ligase
VKKDPNYPHTCPLCKQPAYMGCVPAAVDCSNVVCRFASKQAKALFRERQAVLEKSLKDNLEALVKALNAASYGPKTPVGPMPGTPFGPPPANRP